MRLDLSQSNWASIPNGDARVNITNFIISGHVLPRTEINILQLSVLQLALEAETQDKG